MASTATSANHSMRRRRSWRANARWRSSRSTWSRRSMTNSHWTSGAMPDFQPSPAYRDIPPWRSGVLLVNSGTPDSLSSGGVRTFLRRLLSDPRTVETPRPVWLPILYGIILTLRPSRVLPKYRRLWTERGSPLLVHRSEEHTSEL